MKDDSKSMFAIPWDECKITYIYLKNKTLTIWWIDKDTNLIDPMGIRFISSSIENL